MYNYTFLILLSSGIPLYPLLDVRYWPCYVGPSQGLFCFVFLTCSLFSFLIPVVRGQRVSPSQREKETWQKEVSQEADLENGLKVLVDLEEKEWKREDLPENGKDKTREGGFGGQRLRGTWGQW